LREILYKEPCNIMYFYLGFEFTGRCIATESHVIRTTKANTRDQTRSDRSWTFIRVIMLYHGGHLKRLLA
jgi:hypothetical protein